MSQVTLDLSAYDAMKQQAEQAKTNYDTLRKEIDMCKDGLRVVVRTKVVTPSVTSHQVAQIITDYVRQHQYSCAFFRADDFLQDAKKALAEYRAGEVISESEQFVNFEDIEYRMKHEAEKGIEAERKKLEEARKQYEITSDEIERKYEKSFRDQNERMKRLQNDYKWLLEQHRDINNQYKGIMKENANIKKELEDANAKADRLAIGCKDYEENLFKLRIENNGLRDDIEYHNSLNFFKRIFHKIK